MAVPEIERRWIGKFQENLSIIRKVAGWTTQELADELGVARQTVSNLETGKTPMSKLQYLALRTVFNAEIAEHDNRDLARVITTLVDDPLQGETDGDDTDDATEDEKTSGDDARDGGATTDGGDAPDTVGRAPSPDTSHKRGAAGVTSRAAAKNGRMTPGAAMRILTVVTGALASGAAAGALTFLMFPDGGLGKR
ncbi:helix-turn-helix transcriptional regulator [Bifidobacterium stellenboschense]|uniref:Transcriptional regulator n=1 Tax=Bifidobacterium stellenboschense TaxID=762211 RepID=A0A087DG90_9BIFI|nr:helix-turn-helix transcriptional regulator [Bifidobacterium stellenboschense]KFI94540.1 transcriptional regulator [Bifidobacterium stellenboschense]